MSKSMRKTVTEPSGPVPVNTAKQDLIDASRLIGRKWQTVIIHRLLRKGPMGFSELKDEIGSVSSKVLSDNLADLEEAGLLTRELVQTRPMRVEYSLTAAGEGLEEVIEAILDWQQDHHELLQNGES